MSVVYDAQASRSIVAALQAPSGLFEPTVAPAGDGPGALLFDRVDERLLALAHEHSRAGRRRVLAIAATPSILESAAVWELLQAGAADVVAWDGDVATVSAQIERWRAVDELVASPLVAEHLVGSSPAWRAVLRDVVEIARFSDVDVLITGESGTTPLAAQPLNEL
jgi:DNA-binding NtrC family response regulator